MEFLLLYHYCVVAILVIIFINYLINNHVFKNTSLFVLPREIRENPPFISILIPARNEDKNIRRCLRSILRQDYPNFEVIVLDDNSSDNTSAVVQEYVRKNKKVRLVKGSELPNGWLGKSYACQQLSQEAKGEFLIFTDADTLHFKNSISCALGALLVNKLDALSVFARQVTVTIHERMMVPFGNYFLLAFMPLMLIGRTKNPLFCTAIGQFMMFKHDVYKEIGGHESVKKEILEDIHISKQVKKHGFKFMVFDGRNNFYCRMYKNLGEVIRGYSKVLAAVFNYNVVFQSAITILVFAFFLAPFILFPLSLFIFDWSQLIINLLIIQICLVSAIKVIQTIRFKDRFVDIFLFPLSIIYLLLISIHSMIKSKTLSGVLWKGRIYDVRDDEKLKLVKDLLK